jgi:feruloyl esterase
VDVSNVSLPIHSQFTKPNTLLDRDLKYTLGLGFATVGANNGHNGTSGLPFYNNTEVVHDFADRSIHLGVVIGKQITAQYYGSPHTKSYYLGCSTGGRQGFKSVQTYPEDFDGVVAGAPAFAFTNLTSWSATFYKIFGANSSAPTFIPAGKLWTVIHNEVLKQCDGLDGVVDGILEDPSLCQFRPEALICGSKGNGTDCLSPAQAGAVREALSDYYGVDGSLIYPGMQPGSEIFASRLLYSGGPFPYSVDWFRYVVYSTSPLIPFLLILILYQMIQRGLPIPSTVKTQPTPPNKTLTIYKPGPATFPPLPLAAGKSSITTVSWTV